jgi:hypothetical protein
MGWHVTRSHLLVALSVIVLFGLFLQLDLSFRFTDSRGSDSLLGFKLGIGGRRHSVWDSPSSRHGYDENSPLLSQAITVADVKVKWGEEGAPRTSVLAHAPGEFDQQSPSQLDASTLPGAQLTRPRMDSSRRHLPLQRDVVRRYGQPVEHSITPHDDFDRCGDLERPGVDQPAVSGTIEADRGAC